MTDSLGTLLFSTDDITLRSLSVSQMENNVYLLTNIRSGEQIMIDAAADAERLCSFARDVACHDVLDGGGSARITTIFTTHGHWDHIRALEAVAEASGARTYAGAADIQAIESQENYRVHHELHGQERFEYSSYRLETISLVGHTPGSIAYVLTAEGLPTVIFSGDSLFPGGVGKTDSPEDFCSLFHDVTTKLFDVFSDDTVVLPGHGKGTTLGQERPSLEQWKERGW
ncbi:MBL fold metallo-hydrolase [Rothia sp. P7181]|uniref:MBL fold metallo-hydrolase n=1 Tax=unclassified Rothia (in: high G+C Gram-positive bacteria) TaxID=2689056 RepID=UPI003AD19194